MNNNYLKEFTKNAKISKINIGYSSSKVYKIIKNGKIYFLKKDKSKNISKEYFLVKTMQNIIPVPNIKYYFDDGMYGYLLTKKIPGYMICDDKIFDDGKKVVQLAALGLKILQSVDINDVQILNNIDVKLEIAKNNIENNSLSLENMSEKYKKRFSSYQEIYNYLIKNKPKERLCFSHGDYSLPNIYCNDNKITGFLDLGDAGIADYWYDIAILVNSLRKNYDNSEELEKYLFELLKIKPNYKTIEYYILLTECFL